jgi:hypothetical protein
MNLIAESLELGQVKGHIFTALRQAFIGHPKTMKEISIFSFIIYVSLLLAACSAARRPVDDQILEERLYKDHVIYKRWRIWQRGHQKKSTITFETATDTAGQYGTLFTYYSPASHRQSWLSVSFLQGDSFVRAVSVTWNTLDSLIPCRRIDSCIWQYPLKFIREYDYNGQWHHIAYNPLISKAPQYRSELTLWAVNEAMFSVHLRDYAGHELPLPGNLKKMYIPRTAVRISANGELLIDYSKAQEVYPRK